MTAFACNQRDEVRDLRDVAAAVCASHTVKQQTFIADTSCLTPWDTQQKRIFTEEGVAPTLAGADGGGGRNPAGLLFSAGFSAGASPTAGNIGYQDECAPTLKAGGSGTNMVPSILCLNDQGGQRMDISMDTTGTLRAAEKGHQPVILFESHGQESRYTGPQPTSPTVTSAYGSGGGNTPMILEPPDDPDSYCIAGNIMNRKVENGGNHMGFQANISYTLNTCDRHAVFSRQRVDVFAENDVVATQSARQYKDATDLILEPQIYQQTVGTIGYSDHHGINNQYVSEDKCIIEWPWLIRKLTPLECERLQGFPDYWTLVTGASDSARYKALGNSVAVPCVEYVLRGVAYFLRLQYAA